MKRLSILIVGLLLLIIGCTTTPAPTPDTDGDTVIPAAPATGIGFAVEELWINYDIADKKPIEEEKCYKVLKVTRINDVANNIWFKAGLLTGDYIVMTESRPGMLGTLRCENADEAVKMWFPGKAMGQLCRNWTFMVSGEDTECDPDPDGFWIERLRFENDKDFSLKTLQVKYE